MKRVEVTTSGPLPLGAWVQLNDEGLLRVVACTSSGVGPYVIDLVRVRWWHRAWAWPGHRAAAARRWWLWTRCLPDRGWCWRRATTDCLCDRHWLKAVERGGA